MTMTGWDWAIWGVTLLWIAGLVAIAVAALRIVRGPVADMTGHTRRLINQGKAIATTAQDAFAKNKTPILHLVATTKSFRGALGIDKSEAALAGEPFNLPRLLAVVRTLSTVQGGVAVAKDLFNRKKPTVTSTAIDAKKAVAAPVRPSLIERAGLVPPAFKHIQPVLRVARFAWQARKSMQARGLK